MRIAILLYLALPAAAQVNVIEAARIRPHVKFLSSDLLEGRGVGTRGGQLAVDYIAAQLASMGLTVRNQEVRLVSVTPREGAKLSAAGGGKTVEFAWMTEFTGRSLEQTPVSEFGSEAIFAGHGITAPEFGWNDYEGVDVKGKVVVLFTNEPPSEDPGFFGGKALTYYGRWTYKYEEAARRGASAVLIVHTTPTAGYGWSVVQGHGREQPQVKRSGQHALALAGWITADAASRLFSMAGMTVEGALNAANTRGFRARPLGVTMRGSMESGLREIVSTNVVGIVDGSDPVTKNEAVVLTAHWDHLGTGEAVNNDRIYNGAVDNATGCAMLLEMARAWVALQPKPKRTALFVFVTSEESGLLGSQYYAENPLIPAGRTAVNLNFDGYYPFGRTTDVVVDGAERTTFWPVVRSVAQQFNLTITPDAHPEQGHFYRSDHFSMAKVGVPAFSVAQGSRFAGKPEGYGEKVFQEYNEKNYHAPSDEYGESWDFSGMEQIAKFGFTLGLEAANLDKLPVWNAGDEFQAARQKSLMR